jgi:hypothetical protein
MSLLHFITGRFCEFSDSQRASQSFKIMGYYVCLQHPAGIKGCDILTEELSSALDTVRFELTADSVMEGLPVVREEHNEEMCDLYYSADTIW